jgi:hypothetical protein
MRHHLFVDAQINKLLIFLLVFHQMPDLVQVKILEAYLSERRQKDDAA